MATTKRSPTVDFWRRAGERLGEDYERIRDVHQDDSGTAGNQGETQWKQILESWLPPYYRVKKHGRIQNGRRISGQIDIIVLDPAYPEALADEQTYLAEGVVAAFECKNTLKASHVSDALSRAAEMTNSFSHRRLGSPYSELHRPYFYGLLALSHSWKDPGSSPIENVDHRIQLGFRELGSPAQMLDAICVADLATWGSFRTWTHPPLGKNVNTKTDDGTVDAGYICMPQDDAKHRAGAVGHMLWWVLSILSHTDGRLRRLLPAYQTGGVAPGSTGYRRTWPWRDVFSPALVDWLRADRSRVCAGPNWDAWRGR